MQFRLYKHGCIWTCVISVEERKDEKNKTQGKKDLRRKPSECDKGKKGWSVEFQFGQDDGVDGTTFGRKPTTNSATADQYPGCTHVSSTQAQ
jgi:hypothetical protein